MRTTYDGRTIFEDAEIKAGDVATYYCGTDSYSTTVANVVRFQSGARKGQIKEINTDWHGTFNTFRPVINFDGTTSYLGLQDGKKVNHLVLVVGYATDHRDLNR
jgi:hypothetical protein